MTLTYLLIVFASLLLAVIAYAVKRFFDDRAAARGDTGLVKERLAVFEKALANAISQFAEIVKETRVSELDNRAKTAGQMLRQGRRMPTP